MLSLSISRHPAGLPLASKFKVCLILASSYILEGRHSVVSLNTSVGVNVNNLDVPL